MKLYILLILILVLILLATSCAAPPKPCPKVKIIYDRFDTSVANIEIYNQLSTTYKF